MSDRRASKPLRPQLRLFAVACGALVVACAPAPPNVEITSHADGERVYGDRTITLAGAAANTAQVQMLLGGAVVATVDVDAGAFEADVTLGANANELRAQTPDGTVGEDLGLVFPWVDATTFRPADVVIGQADATSTASGTSATELGAQTYGSPVFVDGILYLPDPTNHRILGYVGLPTTDGVAADFVLGQASFTTGAFNDDDQDGVPDATPTARTLSCPSAVASDGTRLFVVDSCNDRVLIFDALPTTDFVPADVVVGQATMTSTGNTACSLDEPFSYVERLAVGGGRLVVPDTYGHRVLVWNTIPTENGTEPDVVLGQPPSAATCAPNDDDQDGTPGDPTARTFASPWDVWTDGHRLLVTDLGNHRVLVWESFPTSAFAPADLVIGQTSMTTGTAGAGAAGFDSPFSIASNGNQILVEEYYQARVLVYDAFPTENGAMADAVLGQSTFAQTTVNDDDQDGVQDANPTARTLSGTYGSWMGEGVMILNDIDNHRFLLYVD